MPTDGPVAVAHGVERLLEKLNRFSSADQRTVGFVDREVRRAAWREFTEHHVLHTSERLRARVSAGERYAVVALGLKLATTYTLMRLRNAGAAARTERGLAREAFHLIRLELRSRLGMRPPEEHPCMRFGASSDEPVVEAWSDAGVRAGRSAAGLRVEASPGRPGFELARFLPHHTALAAELQAAQFALEALRTAGVTHARLNVDSLGVLRAFQGRLALRFCVDEALLIQLAGTFDYLEVRLIPRAFNRADALATGLLVSSGEEL